MTLEDIAASTQLAVKLLQQAADELKKHSHHELSEEQARMLFTATDKLQEVRGNIRTPAYLRLTR